jgi:hypothetical protein
MDEIEILKYLYENNNGEKYTDLLEYFMKEYPSPNAAVYQHIVLILTSLINRRLILLTKISNNSYKYLGQKMVKPDASGMWQTSEILTFDILKSWSNTFGMTYDGIMGKILLDGKKEIDELLFKEQLKKVNQSVIDSNNLATLTNDSIIDLNKETKNYYVQLKWATWVIAGATFISMLFSIATCHETYLQRTQEKTLSK